MSKLKIMMASLGCAGLAVVVSCSSPSKRDRSQASAHNNGTATLAANNTPARNGVRSGTTSTAPADLGASSSGRGL